MPLAEETVSVLHMLDLIVAGSISLALSNRDRVHPFHGPSSPGVNPA